MKIKNVAIKNFRGYSDEINSDFEDLTAFVGKNDIGKSTILEALDIFFNDGKGVTKLDKADLNVESKARQETDISIRVCFTDLPEKIVIDTTNETSLSAEYLLNSDGLLEVVKRYPNAGTPKVFICAMHPTNPECKVMPNPFGRSSKNIFRFTLYFKPTERTVIATVKFKILYMRL